MASVDNPFNAEPPCSGVNWEAWAFCVMDRYNTSTVVMNTSAAIVELAETE